MSYNASPPEGRFQAALRWQGRLEEALANGRETVHVDYPKLMVTGLDYPLEMVERLIAELLRPLSFEKRAEFFNAMDERQAA